MATRQEYEDAIILADSEGEKEVAQQIAAELYAKYGEGDTELTNQPEAPPPPPMTSRMGRDGLTPMGPPISTLGDGSPTAPPNPNPLGLAKSTPKGPEDIKQFLVDAVLNVTHPGFQQTGIDASVMNLGNEIDQGIRAVFNAGVKAVQSGNFEDFGANVADSYRKGIDTSDDLKKAHKLSNPKTNLALNVGMTTAGGTVLTKAANPATWRMLMALGAGEGGVTAWGDAPRGEKTAAAGYGAGLGAGATGLLPPIVKGVTKGVPKVWRGINDMLSNTKRVPTDKAALREADDAFGYLYTRTGGSAEEAKRLSEQDYLNGETVADVIPETGASVTPLLAARSDDIANQVRRSEYVTRQEPDAVINRVASGFEADKQAIANSTKYRTMLGTVTKSVGKQMDTRIRELHGVPIKNVDELEEFTKLGKIKPLLKEVEIELEAEGLKPKNQKLPGKTDAEGRLLEGEKDVNIPIMDEAYVDQLGKAIQKRITEAEEVGVSSASWMSRKRELREIAKGSNGDPKMNTLRARYNSAIDNEQAFYSGRSFKDEFNNPIDLESLPTVLGKLDESGKAMFRRGALVHYAKKGDKLLESLGSKTERDQIGLIFGGNKAQSAKDIAVREDTFADVSEAVMLGAKLQGKQAGRDLMAGNAEGIQSLFSSLEGKRAYSGIGAIGLGVNEVISYLQKTELSDKAADILWKRFASSGTEINRILKQIPENLDRMAREKVLKAEMKGLVDGLKGGIGAGAGSLGHRLSGGYFDDRTPRPTENRTPPAMSLGGRLSGGGYEGRSITLENPHRTIPLLPIGGRQ